MNTRRNRGFSIIELMVGITVLAILLGIGVPSFTTMIRNNRLAEQANEIVGAMMFARSEALKRGIRVSVCPGLNDTCSGAMDWNAGIVVFTDDTGTIGVRDSTDVVLRTWRPRNNGFVSSGGATSVSFVRSGAAAATQIDIYKSGCTGPNVRRVAVAVTGRVQSSKENCS